MTSQIDPGLIDGAFPIQGVDNPSQGFRTNFTNTGVNFTYAANEITDLQNKAVLKAALTGQTLNNDLDGSPLSSAVISNFSATVTSLGSQSGTVSVNYVTGHYQTVATTGPISLSFTGWPISGQEGWVTLAVSVQNVAHTLTLPTSVTTGLVGVTGAVGQIITFPTPGLYLFTFTTSDGGFSIVLSENNTSLREFNSSSENISTNVALSPIVNTSYFTAATTTTLAVGVEGQVRTLAQFSPSSSSVTVASAAWQSGASGTVTLAGLGSTATLKVIGGYWFAIGSNAATFA